MTEPRATPAPAAPDRLETPRLVLTRPVAEDAPELAAMLCDPRVGRWLGGTLDRATADAVLSRHIEHWAAHGFGLWMARDRAGGEFAGRGGLHLTIVGGRGAVEVGWSIVPERWGAGLATEIGAAAIGVARDALGLESVVSYTMPDNRASRRVMEKLGLREHADVVHRGLPHVLYEGPTTLPGPAAGPAA